jgi:uncharacterized protein (DUF885 family)
MVIPDKPYRIKSIVEKIMELRQRAQDKMGAFDIRKFMKSAFESGVMPLAQWKKD